MLKTAVIGVGNMGSSHVRVLAQMDTVRLAALADVHEDAIQRATRTYRLAAYIDYREMLDKEKPDFVSIALPTEHHAEAAIEAIQRGIHVLVEKPLALNKFEGQRMIDEADKHGVKLMVGHIERFNPAIIEIRQRLAEEQLGKVFQIHCRRLSPFPPRIRDVGVVLDLATHEIDAMLHLVGGEVERVYAEIERKAHDQCEDILSGLVRFRNGVIGVLDVNWLTPTKVRQLAVLGERGMYLADYLTQDVYYYENDANGDNGGPMWDALAVFAGVREGRMVKLHFQKREPLRAELESFADAVREDLDPVVSGQDGLAALELANALIESGTTHSPVQLASTGEALCQS